MDEAGENERRTPNSRRAKQAMQRIADTAERRRRCVEPFAALHLPFEYSLSHGCVFDAVEGEVISA